MYLINFVVFLLASNIQLLLTMEYLKYDDNPSYIIVILKFTINFLFFLLFIVLTIYYLL